MTAAAIRDRALHAVQCAVTLVAILGGVGLIAWAAGLASLADLPWALGGVFGGSFAMALVKADRKARPRY